jgi:hypothetical protein
MTGLSRKKWIKLTLLLGAVRWYNVLLLTAAQYILAFFEQPFEFSAEV